MSSRTIYITTMGLLCHVRNVKYKQGYLHGTFVCTRSRTIPGRQTGQYWCAEGVIQRVSRVGTLRAIKFTRLSQ